MGKDKGTNPDGLAGWTWYRLRRDGILKRLSPRGGAAEPLLTGGAGVIHARRKA
jgi:hypothetical protein